VERESSRILEENRARLEQLQQQEIARIQQEAARARAEISRLVVNLSIDAAAKVIGRSINDRDNRRLVEEFVSATEAKEQ
jgi:F-type H+-transporting ATPase subunit b